MIIKASAALRNDYTSISNMAKERTEGTASGKDIAGRAGTDRGSRNTQCFTGKKKVKGEGK